MSLPLEHPDTFVRRHIGPSPAEQKKMLAAMGIASLDALVSDTVPQSIRMGKKLELPAGLSEAALLERANELGKKNEVWRSYLGMGYSDCITPPVILRNIVQNPGWYTQYTPYQAEIAQGRLEALLNFQTMVIDLTGLPIANASLLDEATAAAEAMHLANEFKGSDDKNTFFVSELCHPQTIDVVQTRARASGVNVVVGDHSKVDLGAIKAFGALVQYPATDGALIDYAQFGERVHAADALFVMAADILALTLVTPPGEMGADVAIGSTQRLGVPLGYGGPHAAYMALKNEFVRKMPGRIIGVSEDARKKPALRMALQTREQHIRRERATSNICTAQALLAVVASMYAVYHGPKGLRAIAEKIHQSACTLRDAVARVGVRVGHDAFFDTVRVEGSEKDVAGWIAAAEKRRINIRKLSATAVSVALDETVSFKDLGELSDVFAQGRHADMAETVAEISQRAIPKTLERKSKYLEHEIFNTHHSETEMLRYMRKLESRDLSLAHSMIPLGSCTMKLNATSEMFPISWPAFSRIHPYAPGDQVAGYLEMADQLADWLAEITGLPGVSLEPNAGSQGEYAGLLCIDKYHASRGEPHRKVCLIPTSAHGTNPASAVMAGMKVVAVKCDEVGNIDVADLREKAQAHAKDLAALMITYPSTHGVFEETVQAICGIIHDHGGLVYMDGANMNAQVGLTSPGRIGADVCHLNLHKTFCIPHGGGGPGMGPICVSAELEEFLPDYDRIGPDRRIGSVSAAPLGSASILPIPWMYIRMTGAAGLTKCTKLAILNANYIAHRLQKFFPVLYRGANGHVAHECILDLRGFKKTTAEDVAKRLMDYGFHAPTLSWPVTGTLMVEPTESESKMEIDRFCEAMISIHAEMVAVEEGKLSATDNPLKNAPHTARSVCCSTWEHSYTREQAAYPAPWLQEFKFWPAVGRIDNVFGDRNLICTCPSVEEFANS